MRERERERSSERDREQDVHRIPVGFVDDDDRTSHPIETEENCWCRIGGKSIFPRFCIRAFVQSDTSNRVCVSCTTLKMTFGVSYSRTIMPCFKGKHMLNFA